MTFSGSSTCCSARCGAVGGGASRAGVLEVAEGEAAVAVRTGGGEE